MIIRSLKEEDKADWLPLWQGYLDFYQTDLTPEITENTWRELSGPGEARGGFAAVTEAGEMAGFVTYLLHGSTWSIAPYCYLEDLYVSEAGRGKGTGRALIEAVYAEADKRDAKRVYWVTNADNITAQKLYDRIADKSDFIQYRSNRLDG